MAEAVVSFFLGKLAKQLSQEAQLLSGVEDDVVWIKAELQSMKSFLKDADHRRERDAGAEAWIMQVRRLVFDAEDTVDEHMIKTEMHRRRRDRYMGCLVLHACFVKNMIAQHQFSTRMQRIRKEVKDIHERRGRYEFHTPPHDGTNSNVADGRHGDQGIAAPWAEEPDIVGLEGDVKKLEEWLLKEEETHQRKVISIVGMGGLGKTTLAKKVYKVAERCFQCYAWVHVSQSFQIKDILKRMLKDFYESRREMAPNNSESSNEIELARMIHSYLQQKRYALVLDDIWDIRVWENVKHALPRDGAGRIIFTTRIENVASPANERCYLHKLKPLSHELAWELFSKKAFMNKNTQGTCPQHLVGVGEAMVKKCKGLPLAIVAIGGLMSKKSTHPSDWYDVLENLDLELNDNEDLARLNRVLLTSYNYLPFHLKYCFLYCGLFPEDHEIKRNKLIRMWVAEGFIEEHPRKTPEEVSSNYFAQLIDRNMLQPVIQQGTRELKSCQVHDLMRDIAIHMFKKEEFAAIITNQNNNVKEKQRRLTIQNDAIDIPASIVESNPRSFLTFNVNDLLPSSLQRMLSQFKFLRVLDLGGTKIKNLPDAVGGLIHLHYLSLRRTQIEDLPASLQKLHNLQTLDVRDSNFKGLPTEIEMPLKLRHLLLRKFQHIFMFDKMPKRISSLSCLQTLSGASADGGFSRELGYLTQLKKLSIGDVKTEHCRQLCSSISQLQHLRSLKILVPKRNEELKLQELAQPPEHLDTLYLIGTMKEFPQWVGSLNCLRVLEFVWSRFVNDPLITLGQLPNLVFLGLTNAYMGKQIACTPGGFPKLKTMVISDMENLEEWRRIEEGTMKSVQNLLINGCPKLKMLPDGLQHLLTIKELAFGDMPEEFMERVKSGGDDYLKVHHIPAIKTVRSVRGEYIFELL